MKSFLQHLGHVVMSILHFGEKIAVIAAPEVALLAPSISGLYTGTLSAVIAAEQAATAAGQQEGSGAAKSAAAVQAVLPIFNQWAAANNITVNEATVKAWVDAVVASLNAIPAPTVPAKAA